MASTIVSTVVPSAMPAVSPAVHTPPNVPALPTPCDRASCEITSGSIAIGRVCMPAYAAPAIATGAYSQGPGTQMSPSRLSAASAKMIDAMANERSLPIRREMTAQSGAQSRAGATSARNRKVTPLPSTHFATYCAPASMTPVARPCSTNVSSSARNGWLRRSACTPSR